MEKGSPFFFRQESQALLFFGFEDMEVQIKGVTSHRPSEAGIHVT